MYPRIALALTLAAPTLAQTICLAEGTPGSLSIVAIPESAPTSAGTTVLAGVSLLPIEITGRYLGQENDTHRSRRIDDHGVVRVELPGNGRLLRYRTAGGAAYGFLHVAADGTPRVVLERPALGGNDPFADRIGVARNGDFFAVAGALTGLHIVRLDGQSYPSTGAASRQVSATLAIEGTSVMVGDQVVWYQAESPAAFRCGFADGAVPVDVSPPLQPGHEFEDNTAMSGDGSRIAFLYGPNDQERIWTADLNNVASVLPPGPSKYEDPEYLPEGTGSPALLLNEDGTRLLYNDSVIGDEFYLLDVTGTLPTLHITDDPIIQPTIGVHILPGFAAGVLTVGIGDNGMMDWYRAELDAQGGTVTNLTQTGATLPPYPEGTLDPVDALDTANGRLLVERDGTQLALRQVDPATGLQSVLHDDLIRAPIVGATTGPTADLVVPTADGDVLYRAGVPQFLVPPGLSVDAPASSPQYSVVWVEWQAGWGIVAFYLPSGQALLGPLEQGVQQITVSEAGGTVILGNPIRYLGPGFYKVLNRPAVAFRRCLSGVGV